MPCFSDRLPAAPVRIALQDAKKDIYIHSKKNQDLYYPDKNHIYIE